MKYSHIREETFISVFTKTLWARFTSTHTSSFD